MAGIENVAQLLHQKLDFRAGVVAGRIDQPRVAGGLAQTEQRLEDVHARLVDAAFPDAAEERQAVVIAKLVVLRLLLPFELAVQRLLDPFRQLWGYLLLRAAEEQRAQSARERLAAFGGRRLRAERFGERTAGAEQSRIEKFEEAPELAEVIFDRCAAEGQTMPSAQ